MRILYRSLLSLNLAHVEKSRNFLYTHLRWSVPYQLIVILLWPTTSISAPVEPVVASATAETPDQDELELTFPTLPPRRAKKTDHYNISGQDRSRGSAGDKTMDTRAKNATHTEVHTSGTSKKSTSVDNDAPMLNAGQTKRVKYSTATGTGAAEEAAPPRGSTDKVHASPTFTIKDHVPQEPATDGTVDLVFEALPPRRAKKQAESNLHQVLHSHFEPVNKKKTIGAKTAHKGCFKKTKSTAKRMIEQPDTVSEIVHARKKPATTTATYDKYLHETGEMTSQQAKEPIAPSTTATAEAEEPVFQSLASTGKTGIPATQTPEELQEILEWTLLENRPRRKRHAPAFFSKTPKQNTSGQEIKLPAHINRHTAKKAAAPSKKASPPVKNNSPPKQLTLSEPAEGANRAMNENRHGTVQNSIAIPASLPEIPEKSFTSLKNTFGQTRASADISTKDICDLTLDEVAENAAASLLNHPEEISQWTLLGDRPKRNRSAPKSYTADRTGHGKKKTESVATGPSKKSDKPKLGRLSVKAQQPKAKVDSSANRSDIAAAIALKMGVRYSGLSLDTVKSAEADSRSGKSTVSVSKRKSAKTSSVSKNKKDVQSSTGIQARAASGLLPKKPNVTNSAVKTSVNPKPANAAVARLVAESGKVARSKITNGGKAAGDKIKNTSAVGAEDSAKKSGIQALPLALRNNDLLQGEWYKGHKAFHAAKLMFPYLPVLEVCTTPSGQGFSSAPPVTHGEIMSPAPGSIFIRCCCCAEVFGRTTFMIHAGKLQNRVNLIKIVAYDMGIGDAFGHRLMNAKSFLEEHGVIIGTKRPSISSMWKVGNCGVPVAHLTVNEARDMLYGYINPTVPDARFHDKRVVNKPKQPERSKPSQHSKAIPSKVALQIQKNKFNQGKRPNNSMKRITCTAPQPPSSKTSQQSKQARKSSTCTARLVVKKHTAETTRDKRGDRVQVQMPEKHDVPQRVVWNTLPVPFLWGNAIQQGYEFTGNRKSRMKVWKKEAEDKVLVHHNPLHQYVVMALADGHGGAKAARFFTSKILPLVEQVLERGITDGHLWDFEDEVHRRRFKLLITEIYKTLDREYVAQQKEKFSLWTKYKGNEQAYLTNSAEMEATSIVSEQTRGVNELNLQAPAAQTNDSGKQESPSSAPLADSQSQSCHSEAPAAQTAALDCNIGNPLSHANGEAQAPVPQANEHGERTPVLSTFLAESQINSRESQPSASRTSDTDCIISEQAPHLNGLDAYAPVSQSSPGEQVPRQSTLLAESQIQSCDSRAPASPSRSVNCADSEQKPHTLVGIPAQLPRSSDPGGQISRPSNLLVDSQIQLCHSEAPASQSIDIDAGPLSGRLSPSSITAAQVQQSRSERQGSPAAVIGCTTTDLEQEKLNPIDSNEKATSQNDTRSLDPSTEEQEAQSRSSMDMDMDSHAAALGGLDTPATYSSWAEAQARPASNFGESMPSGVDTRNRVADQAHRLDISTGQEMSACDADGQEFHSTRCGNEQIPVGVLGGKSVQYNVLNGGVMEPGAAAETAPQLNGTTGQASSIAQVTTRVSPTSGLDGVTSPNFKNTDAHVNSGNVLEPHSSHTSEHMVQSPSELSLETLSLNADRNTMYTSSEHQQTSQPIEPEVVEFKHPSLGGQVLPENGTKSQAIDLTNSGKQLPEAIGHDRQLCLSNGITSAPVHEQATGLSELHRPSHQSVHQEAPQLPAYGPNQLEVSQSDRLEGHIGQSFDGLNEDLKVSQSARLEVQIPPSGDLNEGSPLSEGLEASQSSRLPPATSSDLQAQSKPQAPTLDEAQWVSEYLQRCKQIEVKDVQVLVHMNDDADKATPIPYKASAEADARDGVEDEADTGIPKSCPHDDGCTLAVNVIYRGYIVNCNVGDSRSIVISRPLEQFKWSTVFASDDQDLSRGDILTPIIQAGGILVDDITGREKPIKPGQLIYYGTGGCRVKPRTGLCDNDIGVPTRRGLNLGGTMGDLLFKLDSEKPIMRSIPDVSFVKIADPEEEKTVLLMMSDGLVNFLPGSRIKRVEQNDFIRDQLGYKIDIGMPLQKICQQLTDREELDRSEFDDCAVFALSIERWDTPDESGNEMVVED
ncbi:hypothetical protein SARC_00036 [Sphaeroforma arctica JP610]|uniref:PPM-type phosphatase domain-containing protein n=1 Tax=Sphaeroforma arctica JP610 TaxID=667725 RepID=A0A0L0GHF8_9EUKA|nr:hypothetical protein SARC_00036 [Sphaeroforma arctica JP610]KNC87778.1 hypothetical protein SARC_00036 [Sphaeroforma arctica JP610]|eukprot:XP_014161680.1 hypothetical protein SARC_00036 [Sphaeroforma arctica JP610]